MTIRNIGNHKNVLDTYNEFLSLPSGTKDMEWFADGTYEEAWKLHIYLASDADVKNPTINKTVKYFMDNNIQFKMGNCGDATKKFTIYVGDRDEATSLAKVLDENFGDEYRKLLPEGNMLCTEDQNIQHNIGIRFEGIDGRKDDCILRSYGKYGMNSLRENMVGRNMWLNSIAAHCYMAKNCGYKYLGKDYNNNKWDKEIINNHKDEFNKPDFYGNSVINMSNQEIKAYISKAISILEDSNQHRFIRPNNLVDPSNEGVDIDFLELLDRSDNNKKPLNKIYIKNHSYSLKKADNVELFETKDKSGEEIIWKNEDKKLAKCTLMKEGHSFVSSYDDKDNESRFMVYKDNVHRIIDGKADNVETGFLSSYIKNIVTDSKVIRKGMINSNTKDFFQNFNR